MSDQRRTRIEIAKEDMHFAAAHFTVLSATRRENLHGHNFFVTATLDGPIDHGGLCFDYNIVKSKLRELCDSLDEVVLLPTASPYLDIEEGPDYVTVAFGDERLPFLRRDVKLLPVRNVTVEELAHWFVTQLTSSADFAELRVDALELRVSSGPGQWARSAWRPR
ncbi:MAG: 6-carboxytetrahydropterin synthase [Gammaproteobacteria bacterium]|nr:6-carboxytetrahydropterin synthase [Gammaproteobacteria bacterium]